MSRGWNQEKRRRRWMAFRDRDSLLDSSLVYIHIYLVGSFPSDEKYPSKRISQLICQHIYMMYIFLAKLQKHKLQANTRETCYVKFAYKNLVISKSSLNVCYFIYIWYFLISFQKFSFQNSRSLGCIFARNEVFTDEFHSQYFLRSFRVEN